MNVLRKAFATGMALCLQVLFTPGAPADAQDLDAVKARGELRHLGVPYANFVTGGGDGMDVELMKRFAEHLGVRYQYVKTDWDEAIGDLTGKKVKPRPGGGFEVVAEVPVRGDVIANGMTVIPWREQVIAFSVPTFPSQVWLVARSDSPLKPITPSGSIEQDIAAVKKLLRDRSLLCKENTCLDPALYQLDATGARIRLFPGNLNELAPALLNGEAEVTLLDVPDALVAIEKWPGRIKVIGPVSAVQDMAVAFRRDAPGLRGAFDAFLADLKRSGAFRAIAMKYYPYVQDYYPGFFKGM